MRKLFLLAMTFLSIAWTTANGQTVSTLTATIQTGSGGIAVDAAGNIYLADWGATLSGPPGTDVTRVTPDGVVSVFASGFAGASGNAFDSQGNLFQSNFAGNRISKITPAGVVATFSSTGLNGPVGIAIDPQDNLFVNNCSGNTIQRISSTGESTQFAASFLFNCPNGLARDKDGNLYVTNFGGNFAQMLKVTPSGAVDIFAVLPGSNLGHVTFHEDNLYVTHRGGNRIYKVTLDGVATVLAGNGNRGIVDGPALESSFSLPNDLAFDPTGRFLYVNDVVDAANSQDTSPVVVRVIDLGAPMDTGVNDADLPGEFKLHPNFPNPFAGETSILFDVRETTAVSVTVYDVLGQAVRNLFARVAEPGTHTLLWDGMDGQSQPVNPGLYFYRITAGEQSDVRTMTLVR